MTWLGRVFRRDRLEAQLDAELRDHLERQVADYVAGGMSEAEARRRAVLAFGGVEGVKEACRDARGTRWLEAAWQDLRHGARLLRQTPVFTTVAVLSLALGIGANTAIFSLVDSLLLRSLPVKEPSRLVLLSSGSYTNPIWEQVRARQHEIFEGAAAFSQERFDLSSGGQANLVEGLWVSGGFFDVMGVPAMLGRVLQPADDVRGGGAAGSAAVISHRFWQRHFGGDASVVGRTLTLNRVAFTIVGVTGPEFFGPMLGSSFDVAIPLGAVPLVYPAESPSRLDVRVMWWLEIVGRLRPGQTMAEATTALRGFQPQIREATLPSDWRQQDLANYLREPFELESAAAGPAFVRASIRQPLLVLMAVVGFVLLIACVNIAMLMLARASERRHELAMRRALGASAGRVARQLLTESLLLSTLGAVFGLLFAVWGSRVLLAQLSTSSSALTVDLSLDWRVLAFTAAVAVATALLFGVAPAWRAGRVDPNDALKQQGRTVVGHGRRGFGHPLIVVQVALSLALVFTAGLFMRTFSTLATLDLGFDREPVLLASVDAQRTGLKGADLLLLFERLRESAGAVPGVAHAAVSTVTPISGMRWNSIFEFPGRPELPERERVVDVNAVSPGYFATFGTRLRAGRDFSAADRGTAPGVAVVNEAFVRRFFKGENPIGQAFQEGARPGGTPARREIVGVVADAAYRSVRDPMTPTVYIPVAQLAAEMTWPQVSVSVRSAGGPPSRLVQSVTDALVGADPDVSLTFRSLADQVNASLAQERILAALAGFFGALSLLLAGIGLYGVTSYSVSQRRTEIGVRMALGANPRTVVHLLLRQVGTVVAVGVTAGVALSLWSSRYAAALLYGLEPSDMPTLAGAAVVLAGIAALAAWVPARRAARIDPAEVLREG